MNSGESMEKTAAWDAEVDEDGAVGGTPTTTDGDQLHNKNPHDSPRDTASTSRSQGAIPRVSRIDPIAKTSFPTNDTLPSFSRVSQAANGLVHPNIERPDANSTVISNHMHDPAANAFNYGPHVNQPFQAPNMPPFAQMQQWLQWMQIAAQNTAPTSLPQQYGMNNHMPDNRANYAPQSRYNTFDNTYQRETRTGQLLRQWEVKFSGKRHEDVDEFVERLEEFRRQLNFPDEDILRQIPTILSGEALTWARTKYDTWRTVADVILALQQRYRPIDYEVRLEDELRERSQGPCESISSYIIGMRVLLKKFAPPLPLRTQLDRVYRNLHPDFLEKIYREQVTSLDELERLGQQIELRRELAKRYKPPPTPENSMIRSAACASDARRSRTASLEDGRKEKRTVRLTEPTSSALKNRAKTPERAQPRKERSRSPSPLAALYRPIDSTIPRSPSPYRSIPPRTPSPSPQRVEERRSPSPWRYDSPARQRGDSRRPRSPSPYRSRPRFESPRRPTTPSPTRSSLRRETSPARFSNFRRPAEPLMRPIADDRTFKQGLNSGTSPFPRPAEQPCWVCNELGHWAERCPRKQGVECYKCGRKGVTLRDCPRCEIRTSGNDYGRR